MAKAKVSKPNFDFKKLLLSKGEYFALGVAALFTGIMLLSGVSMWSSAQDPKTISDGLKRAADSVKDRIKNGTVTADDEKLTELPTWLRNPNKYPQVPVAMFPITGPQFDPIAKPDTKREAPAVLPLAESACQVDLVRIPFKAYDIGTDSNGETKIGVIVNKEVIGKMNEEERKKVSDKIKGRPAGKGGQNQFNGPGFGGPGFGGPGMGGPGMGGPGMGGPGMGGPGMGGPGMGGPGMGRPGMGGQGSRFNANDQRTEPSIKYIPIEDLDKAMSEGKSPAMTIIPLRSVMIHMEVPYKRQLEEIKRALRLQTIGEALSAHEANGTIIYENGRIYVGYEVQRITWSPNAEGKLEAEGTDDWSKFKDEKYPYDDMYAKYVFSRKLGDAPEDPFLSLFIRKDMSLVLPLPQLVSELGKYPPLKLPNINQAIDKMQKAGVTPKDASDTVKRLTGKADGNAIFQNQNGDEANGLFGPGAGGAQGMRPNGPMRPMGPGAIGPGQTGGGPIDPTKLDQEIDYLLLRFMDVNIEKGKTYQYRIRLKVLNPNYNCEAQVANPAYAKEKYLYSPWTVTPAIDIPAEEFVYAVDPGTFRKRIDEEFPGTRLTDARERERFQAKDYHAVVEMCRWMMEVRPDAGSKNREPVGTWVVADIPVGRGEYIGRKQWVKLPLWSSETKSYHLREQPTSGKGATRENQPKGWMIDYTTPDILADFSGGKVTTLQGNRRIAEEAATELLIVSPDGRLSVKKSLVDEIDPKRREVVDGWNRWATEVEKKGKDDKKDNTTGDQFNPKPGM